MGFAQSKPVRKFWNSRGTLISPTNLLPHPADDDTVGDIIEPTPRQYRPLGLAFHKGTLRFIEHDLFTMPVAMEIQYGDTHIIFQSVSIQRAINLLEGIRGDVWLYSTQTGKKIGESINIQGTIRKSRYDSYFRTFQKMFNFALKTKRKMVNIA